MKIKEEARLFNARELAIRILKCPADATVYLGTLDDGWFTTGKKIYDVIPIEPEEGCEVLIIMEY